MCTVSVIPLRVGRHSGGDGAGGDALGGFRLVHNRDELLSRPLAQSPRVRRFGDHQAIFPIDQPGGGTWVAATDAGVAFAMLNVNHGHRVAGVDHRPSRGRIIPALLGCDDALRAIERARQIDAHAFAPFRLVIVDRSHWGEIYADGWDVTAVTKAFGVAPLLFTSSGLGDDLVERPRRALFDEMIRKNAPSPRRQDEFHAHRWPDRPHLSVHMSRADARTVSRTVVEVASSAASGGGVTMHYRAADDDIARSTQLHPRQLQPQ
ncbi:MAG: NRDE family protein [Tepidisphaeraceae bacterium]